MQSDENFIRITNENEHVLLQWAMLAWVFGNFNLER